MAMGSWLVAGMLLLGSLGLAGCSSGGGGSDSTSTTAETLTLSGYGLSVLLGSITQDVADGPITTDPAGATLAIDSAIADLGLDDPRHLRVRLTFRVDEDGFVAALAYGQTNNMFADGLAAKLERSNIDLNYSLVFDGVTAVAGTIAPRPTITDDFYLTAHFMKDDVPGYSSSESYTLLWKQGLENPSDCGSERLDWASGGAYLPAGDAVGLSIRNATVDSLMLEDSPANPACE